MSARALAIACLLGATAAAEPATQLDAIGTYASDIDGPGLQLGGRQQLGAFIAGLEWGHWDPGHGTANRLALLAGFTATGGEGATRMLLRCSAGPELVFLTQTGGSRPIPGFPSMTTRSDHTPGVEAECAIGAVHRSGRLELGVLVQLLVRDDRGSTGADAGPPWFPQGATAIGIGVVGRILE